MYSKHRLICLQKTLLKESFYNKFQARVKSSMAQNHKGLFQGRHIKRLRVGNSLKMFARPQGWLHLKLASPATFHNLY
jgi:hypothetical protein